MSDLNTIPLQDGFETSLAQAWNGQVGTMYLNDAPSFTFPVGVTCYVCVDPGKSTMQIAEFDSYNAGAKTLNITNITLEKGASLNYSAVTHSAGAKVIISDNYAFWKAIRTAMNSKLDESGGTITGNLTVSGSSAKVDLSGAKLGMEVPQLTTAERTALTDIGLIVYDTDLGNFYQYSASGWRVFDVGTPTGNATDTVAGSVELATQAEFDAGTNTGGTGATLVAKPGFIQKMVNTSTAKTTLVNADEFLIGDSAASNVNKKITYANIKTMLGSELTSTTQYNSFTLGETMTAADVAVLKTDGNIYKRDGYADTGVEYSTGSNIAANRLFLIDTNKIANVYLDSSNNDVHIKIGTISSGVITYGSEYDIITTATAIYGACKIDTNAGMVCYLAGTTIMGAPFTVSGTVVTVGTPVQINSNTGNIDSQVNDVISIDTNKVLFTYNAGASAGNPNLRCGTVSGNVLTLGTEVTTVTSFSAGVNSTCPRLAKLDTDKALFVGIDNSFDLCTNVLTISGTTISQSAQVKTAATAARMTAYQVSTDKVIIVYDETHIIARYITVSGTTATHQAANTVVSSTLIGDLRNKPLIMLSDNIYGVIHSTDNVTWFVADSTNYDIDVLKTIDYGVEIGTSVDFTYSNTLVNGITEFYVNDHILSSKKTYLLNFDTHYLLGILQESGTATQSKKVALSGQVSTAHSGLAIGEKYYINYDGTYTLDPNAFGTATGQVSNAGKALSATSMLVNIPYEDL